MRFFEELSLNAWPALQTQFYDGWVLRCANGYTKRSNSVNPLYPSSLPYDEKIAYCEGFYEGLGQPAVFKLTKDSGALDGLLAERGYRFIDEVSVRVLSLDQWNPAEAEMDISTDFSPDWLEHQFKLSGHNNAADLATAAQMLQSLHAKAFYATKVSNGHQAACGLGVLERGYLGIYDVVVDASQRRKGFGRDTLVSLLACGKQAGARYAYLQVVVGNTPAEKLYESLGFQESYRYWYRVK